MYMYFSKNRLNIFTIRYYSQAIYIDSLYTLHSFIHKTDTIIVYHLNHEGFNRLPYGSVTHGTARVLRGAIHAESMMSAREKQGVHVVILTQHTCQHGLETHVLTSHFLYNKHAFYYQNKFFSLYTCCCSK